MKPANLVLSQIAPQSGSPASRRQLAAPGQGEVGQADEAVSRALGRGFTDNRAAQPTSQAELASLSNARYLMTPLLSYTEQVVL